MAPTHQDATKALQQGNRQLAAGILATIAKSEPNNEKAWLMLASLLDDKDKKRYCLEQVLRINPNNEIARRGLEHVRRSTSPQTAAPANSENETQTSIRVPSVPT